MRAPVVAAILVAGARLCAGCGRIGFAGRDGRDAPDAAPGDAARGDSAIDGPLALDAATGGIVFRQIKVTAVETATTNATATFDEPVTVGDLIVVMFDLDFGPTRPVGTLVDTFGDVFATAVPDAGKANYVQIMEYGFARASGDDTVTVSLSTTTASFLDFRVMTYAGASALDRTADIQTAVTVSGTQTLPPLTTTGADEVIVVNGVGHPGSFTAGPGFDQRSTAADDVVEDVAAPTPGSYPITVTSMTTTATLTTTIAAFR